MRIFNSYIIILSVLLLLTTVVLAAGAGNDLDIYYICYVIEALIVTELFVYFSERARRALNRVGLVLFAGFLVIVAAQVYQVLT